MEIRPSSALSGLKLQDIQTKQPKPDEGESAVAPLKKSVDNNADAAKDIKSFAKSPQEDVEQAVIEASGSKVRDVQKASDLADDLAKRIRSNPDDALTAQKDPNAQVVQNLLR